ncbi:MAG: tRNA adenosine(34) deaminase TadA [Acidimicrobiia bacterium]|nr:tRNA adenosine(34) deaminase TadA [Acidimicrobiia bacterium]
MGFERHMNRALELAREAAAAGEVPVGAVLVGAHGSVVGEARNRVEELGDATAHAELLALSKAGRAAGDWRLVGHTLVVTLEPCAMCAMAAVWSRVDRIVYGAADPKAGAAWSLYNIPQDRRLNHHIELVDGVMAEESAQLLQDFFEERR